MSVVNLRKTDIFVVFCATLALLPRPTLAANELDWSRVASFFYETSAAFYRNPYILLDLSMACFGAERLDGDLGRENVLFDQGYRLQTNGNFPGAYNLFKAAWELYNETEAAGGSHAIPELQILDFLQYCAWKLEKYGEALFLSQLALDRYNSTMTPERVAEFQSKVKIYHQEIVNVFLMENAAKLDTFPEEEQIDAAKILVSTYQYDYCRDEHANPRKPELASNPKLHCRTSNRGRHPFLIYSPIKEEIVNLDPVVVIIYDVITQKQIDNFLALAGNKLSTAGVVSTKVVSGTDINLHQRRAKNAWIASSKAMEFTRYLEALTGLDSLCVDASEMYQIGYYGIGGHYTPHHDYLKEHAIAPYGDRIATLMLYLNEPEEGGHTMFETLKIRVEAVKGAALFWYNLFRNESLDERTLHCGCPVIRGEKWVLNKWYRFRGQFLHKPCGRTPEETFTLSDFIMPEWMKWTDPDSRRVV